MNDYLEFIKSKTHMPAPSGFDCNPLGLNTNLKPFQRDVVQWSLRLGRSGVFMDTGLGKTITQLATSEAVWRHLGSDSRGLLLTPLAVASQTVAEAEKFDVPIPIRIAESQDDVQCGLNITNYHKIHKFDPRSFDWVCLDEASILKNADGKTSKLITSAFQQSMYRFAYTATPSPNDPKEIGPYAEFLSVMSDSVMKSMFFTHDGGETSKWILRGHGRNAFYDWMASWAVMFRNPSDLGYADDGYTLPELHTTEHIVESPSALSGYLFATEAKTLAEQRNARRATIESRCELLASMVNQSSDPWVIWCNLNAESLAITKLIPDAVEVSGSMTDDEKESRLMAFTGSDARVIVTKPKIAGFGLNWQHCNNVAFLGLSHSFEAFYQAVRRCWRFGQTRPVNVHIVIADVESGVIRNIRRKHAETELMVSEMVKSMSLRSRSEFASTVSGSQRYQPLQRMEIPPWI